MGIVTCAYCWQLLSLHGPISKFKLNFFFKQTQIIAYRGYPSEIHHVTTDDGYILELHRIPRGQNEAADPSVKKRAVFLQHGLLGTSADWVINFTNNSLGIT